MDSGIAPNGEARFREREFRVIAINKAGERSDSVPPML